MDRLRSLAYFIASAEEGSFSAAARRLEVTVPAVAKMVAALERDLGSALFERSSHGLALTAAGEDYLAACRQPVATLQALDEQMRGGRTRARGTVVVGVQHVVAQELLAPHLPGFHDRYPDIQVDLRDATQMTHAEAPGVDAFISFAWPKTEDMVHRTLGRSRFRVCASPAYWAAHGLPGHPRELERHACLLIRTQRGTVMDVWTFEREGVRETVTVNGWLVCSNPHRDVALRMAAAGRGVVRIIEWTNLGEIQSGALVTVLDDWRCLEAPPVVLSYRPGARRLARVRLFIDFVQEIFRGLEGAGRGLGPAPRWSGTTAGRASALLRRG